VTRLDAHRVWLGYQGVEAFAFSLGWTVAAVFFVRDLGLSPLQLVLVGTVMGVAYFLFEVPTGIVADIYSRRTSIVIGVVGLGLAFVWTGVAGGVAGVFAAAALMGFAWTFKSGAADAWLADEVGVDAIGRSYQRGAQAARIGALLGIGAAVALALVDLRLPIVAGGLVLVALGLALAVAMPERGFAPAEREGLGAFRSMARTGAAGARLIRARPLLVLMVGIAFFGGMWSEGLDRLWEAHFILEVGVPGFAGLDSVVWFGILAAGALLLAILVAKPLVRRLEALEPARIARVLFALDVAMIVGTLGFALAGSFLFAVAAFWATRVARSIAAPVYATWLNSNVDESSVRATVISMTNLGDSAGEWGGGPVLGAIANAFGIRAALAGSALALVPALGLYGRAIRHHGRDPELAAVAETA
jgi:DHA3 family tetracycline resistance protein-like MFS transporter